MDCRIVQNKDIVRQQKPGRDGQLHLDGEIVGVVVSLDDPIACRCNPAVNAAETDNCVRITKIGMSCDGRYDPGEDVTPGFATPQLSTLDVLLVAKLKLGTIEHRDCL